MDKAFYKKCIEQEVYGEYKKAKGKLTLIGKIYCKYFNSDLNAVYLIRKKQYLANKRGWGTINRVRALFLRIKLMRRYGCVVGDKAQIGIGLKIVHPVGIIIADCVIGENFLIYQNCTVGSKRPNSTEKPTIGNNVSMFVGSSVIGEVKVANGVIIGANATLLKNADIENGLYCGTPAKCLQ